MDNAGQVLGGGIDVVSFGNQSLTDVAGNRRLDFGIVHVDFGQFKVGFGLCNGRLGLQVVAFRSVQRGFGSVVLAAQRFLSFIVAFGANQIGFGAVQFGFAEFDGCQITFLFNNEQNVALVNQRAFLEQDFLDVSCNLRAQVNRLDGFDMADVALFGGNVALLNLLNQNIGIAGGGSHHRHLRGQPAFQIPACGYA